MTAVSGVLVPSDASVPPCNINLEYSSDGKIVKDVESQVASFLFEEGMLRKLPDVNNEGLVRSLVLLRPQDSEAGLYAFYLDVSIDNNNLEYKRETLIKNVRATRLFMACGLFNVRLYGPVVFLRSMLSGKIHGLCVSEVEAACCISPDLRSSILEQSSTCESWKISHPPPDWLASVAQNNYHDQAALQHLAKVMSVQAEPEIQYAQIVQECRGLPESEAISDGSDERDSHINTTGFVARIPLCLHCRRPSNSLCKKCFGAYFCEPPSTCCVKGWSHDCLCATWKVYVDRRSELSTFDGLGDWYKELVSRAFQVSDEPYEVVLRRWGIPHDQASWWRTETGGWSGGTSASARTVNVCNRLTYMDGFAPFRDIPPERPISIDDIQQLEQLEKNPCGLLLLSSWAQYYKLRGISSTSPVALLLSFPLTLHHAIAVYGEVSVTVASMLSRPVRIHLVGVEKELNFLDLFKEVAFLIPQELKLELVFVVRQDMLPMRADQLESLSGLRIELTTNLTVILVSGTYGDSLDPNFDCGSGPPDMIAGMNAGLYAYESWRHVVTYLYHSPNVVGFFTDYNEHSGVNCASLGGSNCRHSLRVNPFRQPRAMPVYSMNLPQMSNCFYYVFNEQHLE